MTKSDAGGARIDGRTARGVRTRDALLEATMALVDEGALRPTAPRIAERAGVSVRTVFQHFDDLETLFRELGDRAFLRVEDLAFPIDPEAPLSWRVRSFVQQRCGINEAMNQINLAASLQAATSPAIREQFERGHRMATVFLRRVFAPELAELGDGADALFDGLRFATSWNSWNMCRRIEGRSVEASTEAVRRVVETVLIGCGFDPFDDGPDGVDAADGADPFDDGDAEASPVDGDAEASPVDGGSGGVDVVDGKWVDGGSGGAEQVDGGSGGAAPSAADSTGERGA